MPAAATEHRVECRGGLDAGPTPRRPRQSYAQIPHAHTGHAVTALSSKFSGLPFVLTRRVDFPFAALKNINASISRTTWIPNQHLRLLSGMTSPSVAAKPRQ